MDDDGWRPARWTVTQLEERRLAAAVLLRRGQLTQAAIARRFGVSRATVCRWAAMLAREGRRGLRARPKTGRPGRLDERAWRRLGRLLARGAVVAGFETERWTLRRIAALIWRVFGVRYHPRYLERPLKAHGFTVQPLRCHSTRFARGTFGSFARPAGPGSVTSARLLPCKSQD